MWFPSVVVAHMCDQYRSFKLHTLQFIVSTSWICVCVCVCVCVWVCVCVCVSMTCHVRQRYTVMVDLNMVMGSLAYHLTTKIPYLYYHNVYDHQAWLGGDFSCGATINKVTWPFDDIPWQTKAIISLLPQSLWPPNLLVWWLTLGGLLTI